MNDFFTQSVVLLIAAIICVLAFIVAMICPQALLFVGFFSAFIFLIVSVGNDDDDHSHYA